MAGIASLGRPRQDGGATKGYSMKRTRGVPQGAPTSCGLSTMNL